MPSNLSLPTSSTKTKAIRGRMRKKGKIKSLGKESYTLERSKISSEELYISFEKLYKNSGLTVEQRSKVRGKSKCQLIQNHGKNTLLCLKV